MATVNANKIKTVFHIVCICATTALTSWCLYKYNLDEDVSLVAFETFNDDENNIYPSISLCFWNPFLNEKLKQYGVGINTTTYSAFLQGKHWDDRMVHIDYDAVTVSLEEYLTFIGVQFSNFSITQWHDDFIQGIRNEKMPSFDVSNRNGKSKCFSFTMPFVPKVPIIAFSTRMKTEIFPNGKRATHPIFDGSDIHAGGFMTFLHYPGEHLRSYFDKKFSWNSRENNTKNYYMALTVKNMEVLKHRNKPDKPCNTDWKRDDEIVMNEIMLDIGCKPPHWKSHASLKPCSNKQQIKKFKWPTYEDLQKYPPPCQVIEKLQYEYEEFDDDFANEGNSTSWFGLSLFFPEPTYKEIKQVQAYDVESFVGNTGGYIGLFLGYSLLYLPNFLMVIFGTIKRTIKGWIQRNGERKNSRDSTQEYSSIMIELSNIDNEGELSKKLKALTTVMSMINQRQANFESKFNIIETKLNDVLHQNSVH